MHGTSVHLPKKAAIVCGLFLIAMTLPAVPVHAACNFRQPLNNDVPVGDISPAQAGNVVATIRLRFQCTQGDDPVFSFAGANDTGPGLHRMRNLTVTNAYLPYQLTTNLRQRQIDITVTVSEADYRNAWVGAYEDTLTVTILP